MKILIIGHPFHFEKIKNVIQNSFNDIEAEFIEYFDTPINTTYDVSVLYFPLTNTLI